MAGGDGFCSQMISSTSSIFTNFNSNIVSFSENCISDISSVDKNKVDFEKKIEEIYNRCSQGFIQSVTDFSEKLASVVGVSSDEVGDVILSGITPFDSLSCISYKISKIYSFVVSYIEKLNNNVKTAINF